MNLELKKYFAGQSDTIACTFDYSGMELGGVKPFCAPVEVNVEIGGFAGAVRFSANVQYTVSMPCDRCGKMSTQQWSRTFTHLLVRELSDEEAMSNSDEYILVLDETLDLDELIREDILLDLPTKYLCSEDCKGLCPKCGKDLNEGDCGCETKEIDPRLEILKSLLQ